jgi:hypothetical protein
MNEKTENPINESRAARNRDLETASLDASNLDTLIDSALATYAAGEPRLDLSARILGAAHALEPRQRPGPQLRPTYSWAFAAAGWLSAAAMLLVIVNTHNLQIVVQPHPAAAQLAQSAPPTLSSFPTAASASLKPASEQPITRVTHFQQANRAAVSNSHAQPSGRADILQPIAFAPIVMVPIGSGEEN